MTAMIGTAFRESVQSAYDEADAAVEKVAEDRTDSLVEEASTLADARQSAQSELACG